MPGRQKNDHPDYRPIVDAVRAWLSTVVDVADIEQAQEPHGWWCKVTPRREGACAFTFGISDQGEYDLLLGDHFAHEEWAWPEEADPVDLCEAISAGRVTESNWRTKWPNLPVKCVTTVEVAQPPQWWTDVWGILTFIPLRLCNRRDTRYRPYRQA